MATYSAGVQSHLDSRDLNCGIVLCAGAETRSIGIVTASLDPAACNMSTWEDGLPSTGSIRRRDCKHQQTCHAIVYNMTRDLLRSYSPHHRQRRPLPSINVHSGESLMAATARLALANTTVCNPSTFCLWPTLAAGSGFLVSSPLIPAEAIASFAAPHVRVLNGSALLGYDRMSHMTEEAIVKSLRGELG